MHLIVPDVHEQIKKLIRFLNKFPTGQKITFLGDFLDSYMGVTINTRETIRWMKDAIKNPDWEFCFSNHDIPYAFPKVDALACPGFEKARQEMVNEIMTKKDWDRFKLYHWIETENREWFIAHAGIHHMFLHPMYGHTSKKWLQDQADDTMYNLRHLNKASPWVGRGRARGGRERIGGLTWLDWNREFAAIEGLNQIVGHSNDDYVRRTITEDSENYCIDTGFNHAIMIQDDGSVQILRIQDDGSVTVDK